MRYACVLVLLVLLVLLGGSAWGAPTAEPTPEPAQDEVDHAPPPSGTTPLRPVLDYLRYYESQPARVLPHITEHFRSGMEPRLWVDQTRALLAAQGYTRLAWTVHHLELTNTGALVHVTTRARIDAGAAAGLFNHLNTRRNECLVNTPPLRLFTDCFGAVLNKGRNRDSSFIQDLGVHRD